MTEFIRLFRVFFCTDQPKNTIHPDQKLRCFYRNTLLYSVCAIMTIITSVIFLQSTSLPHAHALAPSPLTQQITGFSGDDYTAIEHASEKLERIKHVKLWTYVTSEQVNLQQIAPILRQNFTDRDILLIISTAGEKTGCNEQTCPINISGSPWLKSFSPSEIYSIKSQLRSQVNQNHFRQAVVDFAQLLYQSSYRPYHAPNNESAGSAIPLLLLLGLIILIVILYYRSQKKKNHKTEKLALSQTYQPDELSLYSIRELDKYSQKVLRDADEGIRNYHHALTEATEQLGARTTAEFTEAYAAAAKTLAEAHTIRQQLDEHNEQTPQEQKTSYITLITSVQSAQKNLAQTAAHFNELRKDFLAAPDFLTKLVNKSVEIHRKIIDAEKTMDHLQKTYAPSVLSSIADNVQGAKELYEIAQISLQKGQEQLKQGSPDLVQSVHNASNALRKAEELTTAIDHAQSGIHSAILELPTQLTDSRAVLNQVQQYVQENSEYNLTLRSELTSLIAQLTDTLHYAEQNQKSDPLGSLSRLKEATTKIDKTYHEVKDEQRHKTQAQNNLKTTIFTADAYVSNAADYISSYSQIIDSTPRTRLSEAQSLLEVAKEALSPAATQQDISAAEDKALQANKYARKALATAEQQVKSWQYANTPQSSGNGLMNNFTGSFLGTLFADSLFHNGNSGNSWDYSDSWGSDSWGSSSNASDWGNF